jgi:hypothetical protein
LIWVVFPSRLVYDFSPVSLFFAKAKAEKNKQNDRREKSKSNQSRLHNLSVLKSFPFLSGEKFSFIFHIFGHFLNKIKEGKV